MSETIIGQFTNNTSEPINSVPATPVRPTTEITIPERLRDERLRFVMVAKDWKNPIEKQWFVTGHTWDDPQLQDHIKKSGNYGVLGGHGNLVIIDVDKQWLNDIILDKLPPTFTAKSGGKGMYHLYYFVDQQVKKTKIPNYDGGKSKGEEAGDVVGYELHAVGPSCIVEIHEDGKRKNKLLDYGTYKIVKDIPIHTTTWESLNTAITTIVDAKKAEMGIVAEPTTPKEKPEKKEKKKKEKAKKLTKAQEEVIDEIKRKVNLRTKFEQNNVVFVSDTGNGACPFHDSAGGENLSVNQDTNGFWVWHCFHNGCDREGDIFTFLMEYKKMSFNDVAKMLAKEIGLIYPGAAETIAELDLDNLAQAEQIQAVRNEVFAHIVNGKPERATDMITEYIKHTLHVKTEATEKSPTTWYFDGQIYRHDGVVRIQQICREILCENYHKTLYMPVIDKIQADTRISYEEFTSNINKYPHLLPVKNGILDVLTLKMYGFSPNIYYTSLLPVTYDPSKVSVKIIPFIREIMNEQEEHIETVQEMIGYMLYRDYHIQKGFIQYGDGANGKGVLQSVLREFLGPGNFSNLNLEQLSNDNKFTLHKLNNKYANISDEAIEALEETSILKTLIGNGSFDVSVKNQTGFQMKNTAKMVFSANSFPKLPEKVDDAFFRRWMFIPHVMKYCTPAEMEELSPEERKFARPVNVHIERELMNDDEFSGLLNWALEGLHRIMKNNRFTHTKGIKENKKIWMSKTGSSYVFIKKYIRNKNNSYVTVATLREKYSTFCESMNFSIESPQVFNKVMETQTAGVREQKRINFEGNIKVWTNIELVGFLETLDTL